MSLADPASPTLNGNLQAGAIGDLRKRVAALERGTGSSVGLGGAAIHVGDTLTGEVTGTLASPSTTLTINPAGTPQVAGLGVGTALSISTRTGSTSGRSLSRFTIGATTSSRLVWDDTLSGADQDYWSHYFDAIGFGSVEGKRYRIYDGNTTTPVTEYEPTFKISRYQNATGLAAATTSPPLTVAYNATNAAALMSHFSALYVAHGAKSGNETMVTAIVGTAGNLNASKPNQDALGIWGGGDITGSGTGVGTGGYLEGKRSTATAQALGAELRTNNYSGATAHPAVNNTHGMVQQACGGIWITSAGYDSTNTLSFGSSIGLSGGAEPQFVWGYHVSDANIYGTYTPIVESGILAAAFRDDSKSATSLMIGGTHANAAIWIKSVTGAKETGMGFGNTGAGGTPDTFLYRYSAGILSLEPPSTSVAHLYIRPTAGQAGGVTLWDGSTPLWQLLKQTNNEFWLYDATNSKASMKITTAGDLLLQPASGKVGFGTTSGAPTAAFELGSNLGTGITLRDATQGSDGGGTEGTRWVFRHGFAAGFGTGPLTTAGPSVKVSRYQSFTAPASAADYTKYSAMYVINIGTATDVSQPVAITGRAEQLGNFDATGIIGVGRIDTNVSHGGIGGYFEGIGAAPGTNNFFHATEMRATNYTTTAQSYNASATNKGMGILVNAGVESAPNQNKYAAAGIVIADPGNLTAIAGSFGVAFKVGFAVQTSAVIDADFRSDSSADTSLLLNGTYTTAAIKIPSTAGTAASGINFAGDVKLFRAAASSYVLDITTTSSTTSGVAVEVPTTLANSLQVGFWIGGRGGTPQSIALGAGTSTGFRAMNVQGTYTFSGDPATAAWSGVHLGATMQLDGTSTTDLNEIRGFNVATTIKMATTGNVAYTNVASTTEFNSAFKSNATYTAQTGTESARLLSGYIHFWGAAQVVGAGWTLDNHKGLYYDVPSGAGTITTAVGVDIPDWSTRATTMISLRSTTATMAMQHVGPAIFGAVGSPAAGLSLDCAGSISHRAQTLSPAAATTVNDQAITNSFVRLTPAGAGAIITGFAGGVDGRVLNITNADTTNTVQLNNEDAGSAAANRVRFKSGANVTLAAASATASGGSVRLMYDATTSRWREV